MDKTFYEENLRMIKAELDMALRMHQTEYYRANRLLVERDRALTEIERLREKLQCNDVEGDT